MKRMANRITAMVGVSLLVVAIGASEARAKKAIKGSLTLKVEGDEFGGNGVASGAIDTKKICGAFRAIRVKLLNPPPDYYQPSREYGTPNGKHYSRPS